MNKFDETVNEDKLHLMFDDIYLSSKKLNLNNMEFVGFLLSCLINHVNDMSDRHTKKLLFSSMISTIEENMINGT